VQEQLGSVEANPKTRVMFPDGWARATNLEYRLYLARATCGSETDRETQLRIALAAARRAVELYRNALDYRSMVLMQFDVATVLHQLGENAGALSALAMGLDMDREYGFADEAREAYKLQLTWSSKPTDDAQIAALMQDFPKRSVALKFGWRAGAARITLESRRVRLVDGHIFDTHAAPTFERRVGPDSGSGWSVTDTHPLTGYQPGVWPTTQGLQTPQVVFPPALLPAVSFKVSATGEFRGVTDSTEFATRLAARTEELIRAAAPAGDQARSLTIEAVEATAANLSPGILEAATAENYALETAMWIGATIDQGAWYEISAPLSLPGLPRVVVQNRIEFTFTHRVPCTGGATQYACVEIVYRATPEQAALDNAMADMGLQRGSFTNYTASTEARIVTDPTTLMPYAREAWTHWYTSLGENNKDQILESEHLVSTTSYGAD
jgi:hypothetical protein